MAKEQGQGGHGDAVIVKKIINVAGGHHGGSWKVAYADFVTAMMAFFLLLWLLATTTPDQRTGIAEYFTPTFGLTESKGIGFEGGLTPNEKGHSHTSLSQPGLVAGQVKQGPEPKPPQPSDVLSQEDSEGTGVTVMGQSKSESQGSKDTKAAAAGGQEKSDKEDDTAALKKAGESISQAFEQTPDLQQLRKNIIISNTPEGLKIDVVDDAAHPLFAPGTATMTDTGRLMFKAINGVIAKTHNQIGIAGHTERKPYAAGATYTGWELSSDRANATRRYLAENLTEPGRVAKVTGTADTDLLLPKEPENPRNRRVSITLLRGTKVAPVDVAAPRGLLSVPDVDTSKLKPPPAPPPAPPKPKAPIEQPPAPGSIFHPKTPDSNAAAPNAGFAPPLDVPPVPASAAPATPAPIVAPVLPPVTPSANPTAAPAAHGSVFGAPQDDGSFKVPSNLPAAPAQKNAPDTQDNAPNASDATQQNPANSLFAPQLDTKPGQ